MVDVVMPQMGESIAEGTISVWLVDEGSYVETDQPLVTVSTDKADVDIPSPASGVLAEVLAKQGETVDVGRLIARIDETAGKSAAAPSGAKEKKAAPEKSKPAAEQAGQPPEKAPSEPLMQPEGLPGAEAMTAEKPEDQVKGPPEIEREQRPEAPESAEADRSGFYTPAVMRLAIEHGVDLAGIRGTGAGGRVTKKDVLAAVGGGEAKAPAKPARGKKQAATPPVEAASKADVGGTSYGHVYAPPEEAAPPGEAAPARFAAEGFGTYRPPVYGVEPGDTSAEFSRLRRLIADHMVYSKRTAAHVTTFAEADLESVFLLREMHKDRLKGEGVSLTYLPFVMAAALKALRDYPLMNSVVQEGRIITKQKVNLGVAVDTERGLVVPVIKDAGRLGILELARAVNELSERARDSKLSPDELTGGTFTVTNPGRKGNLFGTPIINQPQVAILRMGELVKKPVVVEVDGQDALTIHPMMFLSLSYDHRVVDGLTSNEFLYRVKENLEEGEFRL